MKSKLKVLAVILLAFGLSVSVSAATKATKATKTASTKTSDAKPFATVNGVPISQSMATLFLNDLVVQGAPNTPDTQKQAHDEIIQREVVAQAALAQGMDKQPDVQTRFALTRQSVLVGSYLDNWTRNNPVTDAQMQAEYDRQVKLAGDKEYSVRHIQVATEAEAEAIIKKLQAGEKFEDLAKDSTDTGTKDKGGDLGWIRPTAFPPEFADALLKLEKGKFTPQPVKTDFGYHVIMLDDIRKFEPPKFEEVKAQIQQALQAQAVQQQVQLLVSKAKVQ